MLFLQAGVSCILGEAFGALLRGGILCIFVYPNGFSDLTDEVP